MQTPAEIETLLDSLPVVLWRNDPDFKRITGLSPRSLANMDSLGRGPSVRIRNNVGVVGYPKPAMAEWLRGRLTLVRAA